MLEAMIKTLLSLSALLLASLALNGKAAASEMTAPALPPEADFEVETACADDTTRFTNLSTPASYAWDFDDPASGADNFSNLENPTHVYTSPGTYTVQLIAMDSTGADTASMEITIEEIVRPLDELTLLCPDDFPFTIGAENEGAAYLWQDGSTDSTFVLEAPDSVTLTITREDCMETFSGIFELDTEENCPCLLDLPNAFTPNGDSTNDFFAPLESNCRIIASTYAFRIYNRWGELVFESNDPEQSWDGTYKDEPAPNDAYFWTLQYTIETEEGEMPMQRRGDVTLLR